MESCNNKVTNSSGLNCGSFIIQVNPNNLDEIYTNEVEEENQPYRSDQRDDMSVASIDASVNSSLEFLWNIDESEEQTDATKTKRKHVVATLYDKLEILKELEEGKSIKYLAKKYGLGRSTIHDLRKKKDKIRKYSLSASDSIFGIRHRKTMRESQFFPLDRALLHWFREERSANRPVSGPQCCRRARQLFPTLGLEGTFDASVGWLTRWKDRHGIRNIGNSLDFIKWPEDPSEEHHILESSFSREKDCESTSEHQSLAETDDSQNEGDKSITKQGENSLRLSDDKQQSKENASDGLENPAHDNNTQNSKTEKDPCNVIPNVDVNKMSIDELTYLKFLVKKLEKITNKIEETSKDDSHDEFGKYISSLIRKLPPAKVIRLKQKLVSEVLDVLLAHEKGLSVPILGSDNAETQDSPKSTEAFEKRPSCNASPPAGVEPTADKEANSKQIHLSPATSKNTLHIVSKKMFPLSDITLPDESLLTRNTTKIITTKSGRKVKPPKIIIEQFESPKKAKTRTARKQPVSDISRRTNRVRTQKKWAKSDVDDISTVHSGEDFNMDTEDGYELSDFKPNVNDLDATTSTNFMEPELIQIKEEIPDYDEYPGAASCETTLGPTDRLSLPDPAPGVWKSSSRCRYRQEQFTGEAKTHQENVMRDKTSQRNNYSLQPYEAYGESHKKTYNFSQDDS